MKNYAPAQVASDAKLGGFGYSGGAIATGESPVLPCDEWGLKLT